MLHLRRSAIVLLIALTIFFNIERLNFVEVDTVNLASFVYVLGIVAVISVIALPRLWRPAASVPLILWLGVYFFCKLFFFNDRPLLGGLYSYLTIAEIGLLAISIVLARRFARGLYDFEEAVANITLASAGRRVRALKEANELIQVEMFRSRHYHRPLTVVVVEPESESIRAVLHRTVQEVQQAMMTRYVFTGLSRMLNKQVGRSDMVLVEQEQNRFIILCPEMEAADSAEMTDRIRAAAAEKFGVLVTCGVASFPDEALTFEELVHQAESRLNSSIKSSGIVVRASAELKKHSQFVELGTEKNV